MCAPAIFPSQPLVSPSIIRGRGLGQGCQIWSCRLCTVLKIHQVEDYGAEGYSIALILNPSYLSEILRVSDQNIGIFRNTTKSGGKTFKQASLSLFSSDKGTWNKQVKLESK